jgi:uncharacterized protein (TIGR02172 family)
MKDGEAMTNGIGKLIGQGRAAEVCAWGEGSVLKLFLPSWPREAVEGEAQVARVAHDAGVPTPAVGEIVELDGRYGVEFDRIDGPSMLGGVMTHPWQLFRVTRQSAELQAAIHECRAPELRSLKDIIRGAITASDVLDTGLKQVVLQRLEQLPDGDRLCHGDFHPDNIIMSPDGPAVIDWSNGLRGDPLADVARTWLLIRLGEPIPGTRGQWLIALFRAAFYRLYLRRYRQLHPFADEDLAAWQLPMVALRLAAEDIPEERGRMMDYIERALDGRAAG